MVRHTLEAAGVEFIADNGGMLACDFGKRNQNGRRNKEIRLEDLRVPTSNRLEKLKGDLSGFHSIGVNDQWRIIFKWLNGEPQSVQIVDYH